MPYTLDQVMRKEEQREQAAQRTVQTAAAKTETKAPVVVKKEKAVKPPKAKKVKQTPELTQLQQKTVDYMSVFAALLIAGFALALVIRVIMWMFGV